MTVLFDDPRFLEGQQQNATGKLLVYVPADKEEPVFEGKMITFRETRYRYPLRQIHMALIGAGISLSGVSPIRFF